MPADLNHWLTKREAAQLLGVAEKTIERLSAKREIQKAERKRLGHSPVVVFNPDELNRIKEAKDQPLEAFPVPEGSEPQTAVAKISPPQEQPPSALVLALAQAIGTAAASSRTILTVPIQERVYLTPREAAALAGLPESYIRQKLADGTLKGIKAGGWRVRREDILKL